MTTSGSATTPSFTLTPEDVTEFLADIDPGGDIRVGTVLSQAAANGEQRVSAGKWHLQVDCAGDGAFTITIHGRRTAGAA
jgi:hypothetical protein